MRPATKLWLLSGLVGLGTGLVKGLWLLFNWLPSWEQWEKGLLTLTLFVLGVLVLKSFGVERFRYQFVGGIVFGLTAQLMTVIFWSVFSSNNTWFMNRLNTQLQGSSVTPHVLSALCIIPLAILWGLAFGGIGYLVRQVSMAAKQSARA